MLAQQTLMRLMVCTLLAAAALSGAVSRAAAFQFAVSPMRFEFALGNRPVTRSLKVSNQSAQPVTLAVRVAHFDLDEDNRVREVAPTPQSLDQWIIIRPLSLTVEAGRTRTIRFAVRPYVRPKEGEHRAMIFLSRKGGLSRAGKLNIGFRFGVAVYAHVGNTRRVAQLKGLSATANELAMDIQSVGNASVRMLAAYAIWPTTKFPGRDQAVAQLSRKRFLNVQDYRPAGALRANLLPDLPVLPGTRRTLSVKLKDPLPAGRYHLLLTGKLGSAPITQTVRFAVGE